MAIVHGYVTTDEAAAYIGMNAGGVAASDPYLDDLITGVSRDIDDHCGQRFYTAGTEDEPVVRYFTATDPVLLELGPGAPLTTAHAVHVDDGSGDYATEITGAQLLPRNAPADGEPYRQLRSSGFTWPTGEEDLVRVAGGWGWPGGVPQPVRIACLIQVARLSARPKSPLGLQAGFGEWGAMRVFGGGWDQDAVARLEPYVWAPIQIGF